MCINRFSQPCGLWAVADTEWNTLTTDPLLKEMAEYIHDLLTKVAWYGYDFQLETEFEKGKMIMQKYRECEYINGK